MDITTRFICFRQFTDYDSAITRSGYFSFYKNDRTGYVQLNVVNASIIIDGKKKSTTDFIVGDHETIVRIDIDDPTKPVKFGLKNGNLETIIEYRLVKSIPFFFRRSVKTCRAVDSASFAEAFVIPILFPRSGEYQVRLSVGKMPYDVEIKTRETKETVFADSLIGSDILKFAVSKDQLNCIVEVEYRPFGDKPVNDYITITSADD